MRTSFFLKSAPPFDAISRNYKARVARWAMVAVFGVLVLAFFRVQILQNRLYRAKSVANRVRIIPLTAPRGFIYDRNGEILAENLPAYSASLLPAAGRRTRKSARRSHGRNARKKRPVSSARDSRPRRSKRRSPMAPRRTRSISTTVSR